MASLSEIRERVRAVLVEVAADTDLTVVTRMVWSLPVLPAVVLRPAGPAEFASRQSGRGLTTYPWDLLVLVSGGSDEIAEFALDELVAADGPIRKPFVDNPTLGLRGGTKAWVDSMDYGISNPWNAQDMDTLGASLRLIVSTTG